MHVVTVRAAVGAVLMLVALGGRTLTNDSVKNKTVCLWQAWITGVFTDGDDGEHKGSDSVSGSENQAECDDLGACPFNVEVWKTKAAIKETLNRPGYPESLVRSENESADVSLS